MRTNGRLNRRWQRGFALLLLAVSGVLEANSLPDIIDKLRPSIVAVGSYQPTRRPPGNFAGTGFAVGDGSLIVTNHHVVPEVIDYAKNERIAVFAGRGKQTKVYSAKVVAQDAVHDLAALRLDRGKLPAMRLGDATKMREGEQIAFTGFPIGMILGLHPVTHQGIVAAISPVVIPQMSSRQLSTKLIRSMRDPYDVLQLDATAYPGNSGSPVFDPKTGQVIGVINSVLIKSTKESALENPTGITYAIPVKFVRSLLQKVK